MAKTKPSGGKAAKPVPVPTKSLSTVKEGRVTKPGKTNKAKSKDIAKTVAETQKSKRAKKEPTPDSASESGSSAIVEENDTSDSSDSSDEEAKVEKLPKSNSKANVVKKQAPADASDDEENSEEDSDSDEGSEEDSEDEAGKPTKAGPKSNGAVQKTNGTAKKPAAEDKSGSDSDLNSGDSSEESESDEKLPTTKDAKVNGTVETKALPEDDSDEDSDDSDDSAESEDEVVENEEAKEASSKKRKAETAPEAVTKKSKTDEAESTQGGSKNLFVGNLSWNIDEEWLSREFSGHGEVVGCRILTDRDSGRSKGYGYVEFSSAESAKKALDAMKGFYLDGRALNVDFATPRANDNANPRDRANQRANRFGDQRSPPSDTLFVGNISFDADEDSLRDAFSEFGTLTRVTLPTDINSGALKGFAYVGFSTTEEAKAAMEGLNGREIAGRPVRLDFATPKSNDGGAPRGGGGRGRGRGGFGDRFGDRGRGGGRGGGGRGDRGRGGRGGFSGRGNSTNRGGFGDFKGNKITF